MLFEWWRCVFSNSFYFMFQSLKNLYKIHWFKCTGAKLLQSPITNYLQITQVSKLSFQFYQKQFTSCLKRFYFVDHKFHLCPIQLSLLIFLVTLTIFHFAFCTVRMNSNLSLSNFYSPFIHLLQSKKNFRSEQFNDDRYF